jgi:glycosyltransferase involved in cell wall biosynthesis
LCKESLRSRRITTSFLQKIPGIRRHYKKSLLLFPLALEQIKLEEHYQRCRAFTFLSEEDIGLTPIEAQACGGPVLAFGRGGALETVIGGLVSSSFAPESSTGVSLAEQSAESLADVIRFFESIETRFSPAFIRRDAERFDVSRFKSEMGAFINPKMLKFTNRRLAEG